MNQQMKRYPGKIWKDPEHGNFCPCGAGVRPPPACRYDMYVDSMKIESFQPRSSPNSVV